MQTTINNNLRKFVITSLGWSNKDIFCNLEEIPKVLKEYLDATEDFKIYEYWNRSLKVCSMKLLNEMFEANGIDYRIKKAK